MTLIRVMLYILLLSTVTMALGSRLTGVVTDGHSGQPLAGAHVLIEASDRGAATAEDGRFLLDDLPAGSLRLRISHIGYQSRLVAVTISEDQDRDLHIELRVRAVEMPAVSIVRDAMIGGSELVR